MDDYVKCPQCNRNVMNQIVFDNSTCDQNIEWTETQDKYITYYCAICKITFQRVWALTDKVHDIKKL